MIPNAPSPPSPTGSEIDSVAGSMPHPDRTPDRLGGAVEAAVQAVFEVERAAGAAAAGPFFGPVDVDGERVGVEVVDEVDALGDTETAGGDDDAAALFFERA